METALTHMARKAFAAYNGSAERQIIDAMIMEVERLTDQAVQVHSIISPKPLEGYDHTDAFKVKMYDALRSKLYPSD